MKEVIKRNTAKSRRLIFAYTCLSIFDDVYADMPWHLAEQREAALAESKAD